MRFSDTLPAPSPTEQEHSQVLLKHIQQAIQAQAGSLSFRDYMHMALYQAGLGYYVAGQHKLGKGGDFTTAAELSPLFSQCLAEQCAQVLAALGQGDILELGAGSGVMAAGILLHLETLKQLPQHYYILEISPELRERQKNTLQQQAPHLFDKLIWLDHWPDEPLQGLILANEVLDAMPVELFSWYEGELRQIRVGINHQNELFLQTSKGSPPACPTNLCALLKQSNTSCDTPYISEYNPAIPGWMSSLARSLNQGAILLIDYGYERKDYYHPERRQGTLICHYRHHAHDNPLIYPGLQDITASVDFTAVAEAGDAAGLALAGYIHQAHFLINNHLETLFVQALEQAPEKQYALAQQVRMLSLPSEMGERFKVIGFTKGFTLPLQGFRLADLRHKL